MLTRAEMRHIVWEQLGIRVAPQVTVQQMEDLLHYRIGPEGLPHNPINDMRNRIISFIRENRDRLSLPCDGDCYQHGDAMVLNCLNLLRGTHGEDDVGDSRPQGGESPESGEAAQASQASPAGEEVAGRAGQG